MIEGPQKGLMLLVSQVWTLKPWHFRVLVQGPPSVTSEDPLGAQSSHLPRGKDYYTMHVSDMHENELTGTYPEGNPH